MKYKILSICLLSLFALTACGSGDSGVVSKGHRDAIRYECKNDPDKKLCGAEVKKAFIDDGNEYAIFNDLNKDQKRRIKMNCITPKKYGLETYNNCLLTNIEDAQDGKLTRDLIVKKPKNNIEKLEALTVRIDIIEMTKKEKFIFVGGGSGVVIDNNLIATNCHVALISLEKPDRAIVIKKINAKEFAVADIYKKSEEHDVCILKKIEDSEFKFKMTPVKRLKKFTKLKKGQYVRSLGTPENLEGHTSQGEIRYLGTAGKTGKTKYGDYEIAKDTKIIEHSAKIAGGSSGGPLFDKSGDLIGLNTFGNTDWNFSVSADHIKELLDR